MIEETRFVFVKIEYIKNILDSNNFDKVMNMYREYIHYDRYLKLLTGNYNYDNHTVEILNLNSSRKLFCVELENIERFNDIYFEEQINRYEKYIEIKERIK